MLSARAVCSYAHKALGAGPVSASIPIAGYSSFRPPELTHPGFASLPDPLYLR
ncbi:hypothetical protein [Mucilaginibacter pankratovii]|uniref:hypothetical protein n=1 Tax=Mucilaginibacter pankratovii TaxID=2772110 RepID=UPI0017478B7A|nr:hypothetical protein [Mucilaginibacter pankratovii]